MIKNKWKTIWEQTEDNKLKKIKQCVERWKSPVKLTKRFETVITRPRIGHTRLTHAYLIDHSPPPESIPWEDAQDPQNLKTILSNEENSVKALLSYLRSTNKFKEI